MAKAAGSDVRIFLNRNFLTKALRFGLTRIDIIDPATPLRFSNAGRQMIVMPVLGGNDQVPTQPPSSETPPQQTTAVADSAASPPTPTPKETKQSMSQTETPVPTSKPALETALSQLEAVKTHHREAIRGLNELTDLLRQAGREQRANEREYQAIRQTLRSLQSVRI